MFVNEHGHVHDLFLLKRVRRGALLTQGRPETGEPGGVGLWRTAAPGRLLAVCSYVRVTTHFS